MNFRKIAAALICTAVFVMNIAPLDASCAQSDFPIGDVNGDSVVDTLDALITLRISLGFERASTVQLVSGDLNGDGIIDSSDALEILKISISSVAKLLGNSRSVDVFEYTEPKRGIDVSLWQEDVDFEAVKRSGIDFVIIRAGGSDDDPDTFVEGFSAVRQGKDPMFEENYAKAKAAGLNVGVYWYSFARTTDEAKREAQACLRAIKGKQFEYPVFYDLENQFQYDLGPQFCSDAMRTFCDIIGDNGYYPAYYMAAFFGEHYLDDDVKSKYDYWVAQWNSRVTYPGKYTVWQYGVGSVNGVRGQVDVDLSYFNYPLYMKLNCVNGWK